MTRDPDPLERARDLAQRISSLLRETRSLGTSLRNLRSSFQGSALETYDQLLAEWQGAQRLATRRLADVAALLSASGDEVEPARARAAAQRVADLAVTQAEPHVSARDDNRDVRWAIYLATSETDKIDAFIAALLDVWRAFGLEEVLWTSEPIRSSWFQQWWTRFKTVKAAKRAVSGVIGAAVEVPTTRAEQAEAEALASLMAQARDPELRHVVIRGRNSVVVKLPTPDGAANMVVLHLTAPQRRRLDEHPEWLMDPEQLLRHLANGEPPALPPASPPSLPPPS